MTGLLEHRLLLVLGKGGVGRTTVAAALARAATRKGKRVLLAQTNAPERLGQLLGSKTAIGPNVTVVDERLSAVNMTPREALREYGVLLLRYEPLYRAIFENKPMRSFLGAFPGLDYWTMLGKTWWHTNELQDGRAKYDLVVLDGPASGHAVAMLRIPDAVASALTQTAPAREIIVIDDGSTDQTAAALAPYSSRIQYVHRENRGKAAARNAGIKMASSDWVAFLDSDDVWYPEWIEIVDTFLTERSAEVDLVFSNYSEWNADNTITESPLEKKKLFPVFQRYGLTIDRLMPAACAVRVRERTIKCRLGAISSHLFLGNFVPTSGVCADEVPAPARGTSMRPLTLPKTGISGSASHGGATAPISTCLPLSTGSTRIRPSTRPGA